MVEMRIKVTGRTSKCAICKEQVEKNDMKLIVTGHGLHTTAHMRCVIDLIVNAIRYEN